jgi:hypothetical protein
MQEAYYRYQNPSVGKVGRWMLVAGVLLVLVGIALAYFNPFTESLVLSAGMAVSMAALWSIWCVVTGTFVACWGWLLMYGHRKSKE